jgi:hypothetical protein
MLLNYIGRLLSEIRAWRAAWAARRDNPIAIQAALELRRRARRRPAWLICSPFMFWWSVAVSACTTYVLVLAYLRFHAVAGSSIASPAFALTALWWSALQLLDAADLLLVLLLLERLSAAFFFCSNALAGYRGARGSISGELAVTALSDHDCVAGVLQHVLALCFRPVVWLSLVSTADLLLYACIMPSSQLAEAGPVWPGGQLAWLIGAALLTVPVRIVAALAAVLAGALTLLSFSPWWRYSSVTSGAAVLALMWHLLAVASAPPGRYAEITLYYFADWLPLVFRTPWPGLIVAAGLAVLIGFGHAWSPLSTYRAGARWGMPALRTIVSTGLLCILYFAVGSFATREDDALWPGVSQASMEETPMLASFAWQVQAASIACPLPLVIYAEDEDKTSAKTLVISLVLRSLIITVMPLLLIAMYLGHARQAVFVRRRVLG